MSGRNLAINQNEHSFLKCNLIIYPFTFSDSNKSDALAPDIILRSYFAFEWL